MKPKMKKVLERFFDNRIYVKKRHVSVAFTLALYIEDGEVEDGELKIDTAFIELGKRGIKFEVKPGTMTYDLILAELNDKVEQYVQMYLDLNPQ